MAYVIERESRMGARFVGMYKAVDGNYKSAGTFESHERAHEVASAEEQHARGQLEDTSPADKATMLEAVPALPHGGTEHATAVRLHGEEQH